jgi:iron complex transport system permease protein
LKNPIETIARTQSDNEAFLARRWKRFSLVIVLFLIGVGVCLLLNIALGSVNVPLKDTFKVLFGGESPFRQIILDIRLPRTLGALMGGASLAVAGLLLQVFFRNPIVEPFVLGISSGASFLVSLLLLGSYYFGATAVGTLSLSAAAFTGAILVMLIVLAVANKVRDIITILVVGLMAGYLVSAFGSFLTAFAQTENVHRFVMWSLGSFSSMTWEQIPLLGIGSAVLLIASFLMAKPLNAFLLGEDYAASMGVNIKAFRYIVVFLSCALAAIVTAFAGPVAFVGLAVPHMARLALGTSDNRVLIPVCILAGALVTGVCDLGARLLFAPIELPISATTALFGAPMVIFFLIKGKTTI